MMNININNYSFITFSIINSTLKEIKDLILEKYSAQIREGKYNIEYNDVENIRDFYTDMPLKGSRHLKKVAFYQSILSNKHLIMFSNMEDGWITLANYITSLIKCEHTTFFITLKPNVYNQNMFINKTLDNERIVYSMIDSDKWTFYEQGNSVYFEEITNYQKRIIKKRLNSEILIQYCKRIGFNIEDDDFFKSQGSAFFLKETTLNRR